MVAIRSSQFAVRKDTLSYQLVIVTRIGKARFDLDRAGNGSGSTAFYTANNCSLPEGRTRIVLPTLAVIAPSFPPGGFSFNKAPDKPSSRGPPRAAEVGRQPPAVQTA